MAQKTRESKVRRIPRDEVEQKILRRIIVEAVRQAKSDGKIYYDEENRRRICLDRTKDD